MLCPGIGGKKGLDLIKEHGSIEGILKNRFNITEFIDPEIEYKEKLRDAEVKPEDDNDDIENGDVKKEIKEEKENSIEETNGKDEVLDEIEVKKEEGDADDIVGTGKDSEDEVEEREVREEDEENEENEEDEVKDLKSKGKGGKPKKGKKEKGGSRESVPEDWLFKGARKLFLQPNVLANHFTEKDLKFKEIDEEGLIDFLCKENGFSEDRVRSGIKRVKESKGKSAQTRIDSFFKILPGKSPVKKEDSGGKTPGKRAAPASKASSNKRGRKPR